jgi:hypothetical protein
LRSWLAYAGAALAVAVCGGWLGGVIAGPSAGGVWFAAALAWTIQLIAFGLILALRDNAQLFMVGWLGGMMLRLVVVGGLALWLTRSEALPPAPTLVSLVVFVFVMLLLEPVFLKRGRTTA